VTSQNPLSLPQFPHKIMKAQLPCSQEGQPRGVMCLQSSHGVRLGPVPSEDFAGPLLPSRLAVPLPYLLVLGSPPA
jgi:hypothetical protein